MRDVAAVWLLYYPQLFQQQLIVVQEMKEIWHRRLDGDSRYCVYDAVKLCRICGVIIEMAIILRRWRLHIEHELVGYRRWELVLLCRVTGVHSRIRIDGLGVPLTTCVTPSAVPTSVIATLCVAVPPRLSLTVTSYVCVSVWPAATYSIAVSATEKYQPAVHVPSIFVVSSEKVPR